MSQKLFHLTRKEREALERRYKQERDKRLAQRLHGILLLHEGKSAKEVAQILRVSKKTVKRWGKAFQRYGGEGLCQMGYERSGREGELGDEQDKELERFLDEQVRSTKEVMDYIEKRLGVKYGESGVLKLLKRLGYSYKQPLLLPSKADPQKQAAFVRAYWERRKQRGAEGKIYFMDGCHCLHNAVAGYGWIKRGKRAVVLTNSGRNRLNILGAYSPDDQSLISLESIGSCDAEMVKALLSKIREANPGEIPLVVILDNARYQHTPEVKELARELNIELVYLPPYSPNLNLIERFWKFMKKELLRNKYYPTFEEFVAAVKEFLRNLDRYKAELESLLTENFQLLDAA